MAGCVEQRLFNGLLRDSIDEDTTFLPVMYLEEGARLSLWYCLTRHE